MAPRLPPRLRGYPAHLRHVLAYNLHTLRADPLPEVSGALGDLPTFLPLFLALAHAGLIAPDSTLVFAGLTNIYTGLAFGIPLPVQPMKAIAAAALLPNSTMTAAEVAGAGLFVAACVAALTLTGTLEWFNTAIPRSVVKGVQLSAGLPLAVTAAKTTLAAVKANPQMEWAALAVALVLLIPATLRPRAVPYVLLLIALSVVVPVVLFLGRCVSGNACPSPGWLFAVWRPHVYVPSPQAFGRGILDGGLSQLPLTALNSVVAVVYLAYDLYPNAPRTGAARSDRGAANGLAGAGADEHPDPEAPLPVPPAASDDADGDGDGQAFKRPARESPPHLPNATAIGLSLLLPNLIGPFLHALPVCHGSGGLAAQHRFGARSGASIILLGLAKLILGLCAGPAVAYWAGACVPASWRGVLVFLAGIGLAIVGVDVGGERASEGTVEAHVVVLVTTAVTLGVANAGVGFVAGLLTWAGQRGVRWERDRRARREGRIQLGEN